MNDNPAQFKKWVETGIIMREKNITYKNITSSYRKKKTVKLNI